MGSNCGSALPIVPQSLTLDPNIEDTYTNLDIFTSDVNSYLYLGLLSPTYPYSRRKVPQSIRQGPYSIRQGPYSIRYDPYSIRQGPYSIRQGTYSIKLYSNCKTFHHVIYYISYPNYSCSNLFLQCNNYYLSLL